MTRRVVRPAMLAAVTVGLLALAIPAVGADPSPSPQAGGTDGARPGGRSHKERGAAEPLTLTGVIAQSTDGKGRPTFSLAADGVTWELSAGPKRFSGVSSGLAAWIGQTVEVTGTHHPGAADRELDVELVNGQLLREPGRPPWARGPREAGEAHPGWKDRNDGSGAGQGRPDGPPGQLTDRNRAGAGGEGAGG